MAVSKMEKVTLISYRENEGHLLQLLQELQNIEMLDSLKDLTPEEVELAQSLEGTLTNSQSSEMEDLELQLSAVRKSIEFLVDSSAGKPSVIFKEEQTLSEFENAVDFTEISVLLAEVAELGQQKTALLKEQQALQLAETDLSKWQYLDVHPNALKTSDFVLTRMGYFSASVRDKLLADLGATKQTVLELPYENQSHSYAYLVYLAESAEEVEQLLTKYSFQTVPYNYDLAPQEQYQQVKAELATNVDKLANLSEYTRGLKGQLLALQKAEEVLLAKLTRFQATTKIALYQELLVLRGWIETDRKEQFSQMISQLSTKENPIVLTYEEAQGTEDVPTLLKNNKLVAPFESLTEMYSLPKYGELDPTPFLMPFYMVFFGMMVADLGYGILMLVGTILAKRFVTLRKSTRKFVDFFQILSVPVMIWGLIYGSFFGMSLPFHLLSTTEDMNAILLLSVIFGFIQLLTGLLINGVQLVKQKKYLESISSGFAWQGILLAVGAMVLAKLVLNNETLFTVGIVLFIASGLSIMIIPAFTSKSKGAGLASGMYDFYGITGYIGDLVSYTRLMALGISGGSIAAAFNMLVSFMPPLAKFSVGIILIVILHALNIFLSLLSAYVHGARLQYVEFFGKFFEGGGRKFSPLKPQEKYMDFKINDDK